MPLAIIKTDTYGITVSTGGRYIIIAVPVEIGSDYSRRAMANYFSRMK